MDIDAVITWVDGLDPIHQEKRLMWMDRLGKKSVNFEKRFVQADELIFCLRSIIRFAPWIRNIYIVTDDQYPIFLNQQLLEKYKIKIISHREIFRGYESFLPVFNSETIESMLWRIEGLAEHFVYFNDDFFLLKNIKHDFFFKEKVILRGQWTKDFNYQIKGWHHTRINAANLLGFDKSNYFRESHTCYPLLKNIFQKMFDEGLLNQENLKFKFRDVAQIYPISLHNHYALKYNLAEVKPAYGCIGVGEFNDEWDENKLLSVYNRMETGNCICLNDFSQFANSHPSLIDKFQTYFGSPLPYEKIR
jgi:hypothetical protein